MRIPECGRRRFRGRGCIERAGVRKQTATIWTIFMVVLLAVGACTSYVYQATQTKTHLARQEYQQALETVEKSNNGSSRLLYLYEKGLILHYANRFEESNEVFEEAERILDELYTRSLSREIGALFTSDTMVEYRGERYEAAFVHYYQILNYLYLNRLDDAVIECRQLNHKLQLFEDLGDSPFRNDPFLQHLTGMVYLEAGDRVDADVSLRIAELIYERNGRQMPAYLCQDLLAVARSYGDREAVERYSECVPPDYTAGADSGILNLFLECGYVPGKVEESVSLPIFKEDLDHDYNNDQFAEVLAKRYHSVHRSNVKVDYWLKVSLPSMLPDPSGIARARIIAETDVKSVHTATVEVDFGSLAMQSFEQRQGTILLKTVARALTKYLAKKKTEEKSGEVAGWVVNIFNAATETADTRSWSTLPEKILATRLVLPAGTHTLTINLLDDAGRRIDSVTLNNINIYANKQHFMNYRIF